MIRSNPKYLTTLAGSTYSPSDNIAGISSATSSGLARGGGSPSSSSSSSLSLPSKSASTAPPFFRFKSSTSNPSSNVTSPKLLKKVVNMSSPDGVSSISVADTCISPIGSASKSGSPVAIVSSKDSISTLGIYSSLSNPVVVSGFSPATLLPSSVAFFIFSFCSFSSVAVRIRLLPGASRRSPKSRASI